MVLPPCQPVQEDECGERATKEAPNGTDVPVEHDWDVEIDHGYIEAHHRSEFGTDPGKASRFGLDAAARALW